MENEQSSSFLDLAIDESASHSLRQAGVWSRFLAITGIVALGLILLAVLISGQQILSAIPMISGLGGRMRAVGALYIAVVVLALVFGGFLCYLLLNFANKAMKGVQENNLELVEAGVRSLKVFFIIVGICGMLGTLFGLIALFTPTPSYYY